MHKEAKTTSTQPPTATLKGYQPCCRAGEESWSKERRVGARRGELEQGCGGARARAWRSNGKGVEKQARGGGRAWRGGQARPRGRRESERGKAKWECENERPKP